MLFPPRVSAGEPVYATMYPPRQTTAAFSVTGKYSFARNKELHHGKQCES